MKCFGKNSFESYIELAKVLEKMSCNSYYELENGRPWKQKNAKCITRDRIITKIVSGHKSGQIDTDTYWSKIVDTLGDYDLPLQRQRELLQM